jgi:hypothetical protein
MDKQTLTIITNLILIALLLGVAIYVYINLEDVKLMAQDPCRVCEHKTGGKCFKGLMVIDSPRIPTNLNPNYKLPSHINNSNN